MPSYLQFILLGCFWGGSFVAIKFALESVPFSAAVFLRVLVGLCFLLVTALVTRKSLRLPRKVLFLVWLNGLLSIGFPFLFLFWAEQRVSAGLAAIMNGTVPIWTALLGFVFLKEYESASWRKMAGVVTGLTGVVVIFWPTLQSMGARDTFYGLLALWAMALLYASGALLAKRLISGKSQVSVFATAVHQHLSSLAVVGVYCLLLGPPLRPADWNMSSLVSLLYLGIFSTGLAFLMFFGLISKWGAVRASTVTYLVPAVCLLLDFVVFANAPHANELLGIVIVFSGILLVQRS